MSDYQMLSEQPALWWLNVIVGLVITLLFYGTFPVVFSKVREKGITKKRYRGYCICAAIVVYIFFVLWYIAMEEEGIPEMAPAVLWTGVFYKVGLSSLEKRGKILSSMPQKAAQPVKEPESVSAPKSAGSAARYDKSEQRPVTVSRKPGKPFGETADARCGTGGGTVCFCRNCGCKLVPDSKFCSICGTKVVREW